MLDKNDVLAYLLVLNHQPTLERLRRLGETKSLPQAADYIIGCLVRLEDQLDEGDPLLEVIRTREKVNGDPERQCDLPSITKICAEDLFDRFLEETLASLPAQRKIPSEYQLRRQKYLRRQCNRFAYLAKKENKVVRKFMSQWDEEFKKIWVDFNHKFTLENI